MKNFEFQALGLEEMTNKEMKSIEGGGFLLALALTALLLLIATEAY